MSERPFTSFRNQRKHFVKCVDCSVQMLPQNAGKERPWAAAATLQITGRVNDGALCFNCADKRRALLGLPAEKGPHGHTRKSAWGRTESVPLSAAIPKKIRINNREYSWNVSTLDALIVKWKEQELYEQFRTLDARWWLVVINNLPIPAIDFSSVPISDGDEIFIVMGRGRYPRMKRHE